MSAALPLPAAAPLRPEDFDAALVPGFRAAMRAHYKALSGVEQGRIARLHAEAARVFRARSACPVCDAPAGAATALPEFSQPHLRLLRCTGCQLVYSRDVLDETTDRARYATAESTPGSVPAAFAALKSSAPYARLETTKLAYVAQCVAPFRASPGRMLDIGCANGATLDRFAAEGWQVAGVEPAPDFAAAAAARHAAVRCGFFPDDAPPGPYDLVTLFDVLEHVEHPLPFLRAIGASLAPGGLLALQVPNFESPLVQLEKGRSTVVTLGHWSYFGPASLVDTLQRAGFRPLLLQSYISELDRILAHPETELRAVLGPWAPADLRTIRPADLFWRMLGFKLFGIFQKN